MDFKNTLLLSVKSAWIIIKLVIPIYILAEVLFFYNTLSYISFLVEPFTSILDLPKEASLAIISGMFLNLYAAIAFAAPLELTPYNWTVLGVYLGICHALIVETAVMTKLGLSTFYSVILRVISGFVVGFIVTLLPKSFFENDTVYGKVENKNYESLLDVLQTSFYNSILLTIKIIVLITLIIIIMEFIKTRSFIKNSQKNISKSFTLTVGIFLGITYGAGILIKEAKSSSLSKDDIFYIGTFLMICHAIIEDTLLFVIFGADFTIIVVVRTIAAIIISYGMLRYYKSRKI